jgi:hypothetical protein
MSLDGEPEWRGKGRRAAAGREQPATLGTVGERGTGWR